MPSWLSGVGRNLDVAGQFDEYNESRTGDEADAKALFADWRTVGDAIFDAVVRFRSESKKPAAAKHV